MVGHAFHDHSCDSSHLKSECMEGGFVSKETGFACTVPGFWILWILSLDFTRNTIYSEDGKVILFVTTEQLIEMLFIKERGEDPSDLIMDMIERFYLQHE